jgi:hypothetical protein
MTEREKVIEALRICREGLGAKSCRKCPYMRGIDGTGTCYPIDAEENGVHLCWQDLVDDALALLKEQEARVLEYSEIEKHPLVWLEDNDKENVIPALFLQYNGWNAEFLRQAPDEYVSSLVRSATVYAVEKAYGMMWRAWSTQPDEQVRRDTPWES